MILRVGGILGPGVPQPRSLDGNDHHGWFGMTTNSRFSSKKGPALLCKMMACLIPIPISKAAEIDENGTLAGLIQLQNRHFI